jgi:hypothetical protein
MAAIVQTAFIFCQNNSIASPVIPHWLLQQHHPRPRDKKHLQEDKLQSQRNREHMILPLIHMNWYQIRACIKRASMNSTALGMLTPPVSLAMKSTVVVASISEKILFFLVSKKKVLQQMPEIFQD